MSQLIHDSFFGRLLRHLSKGKLLPHEETKNPALIEQFTAVSPAPVEKTSPERPASNASTLNPGDGELAEKGRDPNIVTWYGSDDPENPLNWSTSTKCAITFELCYLTFAVYVGSSVYTAGIVDVMKDFGIGEIPATLPLTVFVLGFGLGPMTLAPLSEAPAIGRTPIYIWTLLAFVLLQIPVALSVDLPMLIVFRFITGVLGSPPLATGGASIAEIFTPRKRGLAIGIWGVAAIFGPVFGPLLGGFAAQSKGWRWTIWELMWISGLALIILFFFLPEVNAKNILYRRAHRLRRLTGNPRLMSEGEIAYKHVTVRKVAYLTVVRPWILTFTEPLVFLLHTWVALIFGLLFIWFTSFPLVFEGIYGFNPGQTGLSFLGLLVGALCCIPPFIWYDRGVQRRMFDEGGHIMKPEQRLVPAMVTAATIPLCLFWFGWSAQKDVHWIVPIIGTCFFAIGALIIVNAVLTYLPDAFPTEIPSVMAGSAFMRFSFGAAFPLFAPAMYHNLGIHWASSLLGFLGLAYVPIPFLFYFFGEKFRNASKRARHTSS
ncbi:uncharacterized protein Z520_07601 [Fonsecaea multimorphosa CBS 102226]|uniref:Major facilitator superfamily (MFS) profile domain-containing protein n=1 Tax=Fonsecaea multimorphosa CBS 102226 TaxID=1442371 RepID=A0A0D2IIR0_9EURO|nr:uncharacterized protein Z520_07601 [Fonsecaea multimorphosa CBS 102226]KIX96881.1 hypothetical protein Z520_07601 [Fonsecaea multimorphosa CBS 102226]OAL22559.1 hypothetical protein AYO22_07117 [Fonsecaea multimorphosa]